VVHSKDTNLFVIFPKQNTVERELLHKKDHQQICPGFISISGHSQKMSFICHSQQKPYNCIVFGLNPKDVIDTLMTPM
jgi:hypothetical protein